MKINKNGFTLIELLAVMVVMGILMIVAIPAISRVINNSRLDIFKDNVKAMNKSAIDLVADDKYDLEEESVASFFDCNMFVEDDNKQISPFNEMDKCYVVISYDGKRNHYFFTGIDKTGYGANLGVEMKNLDRNDFYSLKDNEKALILDTNLSTGEGFCDLVDKISVPASGEKITDFVIYNASGVESYSGSCS